MSEPQLYAARSIYRTSWPPCINTLYLLHTGRDVKLAGPRATRKRRAGSLKVQRSPKSASRTNTFTTASSWLCGSASHRLALIIVWQLATLLKEVRTSSLALHSCIALQQVSQLWCATVLEVRQVGFAHAHPIMLSIALVILVMLSLHIESS